MRDRGLGLHPEDFPKSHPLLGNRVVLDGTLPDQRKLLVDLEVSEPSTLLVRSTVLAYDSERGVYELCIPRVEIIQSGRGDAFRVEYDANDVQCPIGAGHMRAEVKWAPFDRTTKSTSGKFLGHTTSVAVDAVLIRGQLPLRASFTDVIPSNNNATYTEAAPWESEPHHLHRLPLFRFWFDKLGNVAATNGYTSFRRGGVNMERLSNALHLYVVMQQGGAWHAATHDVLGAWFGSAEAITPCFYVWSTE